MTKSARTWIGSKARESRAVFAEQFQGEQLLEKQNTELLAENYVEFCRQQLRFEPFSYQKELIDLYNLNQLLLHGGVDRVGKAGLCLGCFWMTL